MVKLTLKIIKFKSRLKSLAVEIRISKNIINRFTVNSLTVLY